MKKRVFFAIVAFLLLTFAVEDWAFYRPGLSKLKRLNREVFQSRSRFLGSQIPADKLAKIKELITQNTVYEFTDSAGEDQASEALGRLMAALKELQIELLSITPKEVVQEDLVTTSPYVMELRCDYHQFAQLLDAIERCNDLMQITKFDLVAVREEVVATLSVDIHLFVGNDES